MWAAIEGFGRYHSLLAALELDVFDTLAAAGPSTAGALASKLGVSAPHLRALLDAVVAMGLLDQWRGAYEVNDTTRRYLCSDGPACMASLIGVAPGPHENWSRLADTVRRGAPAHPIEDDAAAFYVPLVAATFATIAVSMDYNERERITSAESHVLLLLATSGMMVPVSARDLIIVFLGIEIMSVAVYVLAGMNRRSDRAAEGSLKYFLLGAFSTCFLLYGIALVYGATGTTNLTEIGGRVAAARREPPRGVRGLLRLLRGLLLPAPELVADLRGGGVDEGRRPVHDAGRVELRDVAADGRQAAEPLGRVVHVPAEAALQPQQAHQVGGQDRARQLALDQHEDRLVAEVLLEALGGAEALRVLVDERLGGGARLEAQGEHRASERQQRDGGQHRQRPPRHPSHEAPKNALDHTISLGDRRSASGGR